MYGNILIIDDEEHLRSSLARVLKNAGYSTSAASSGEQALRLGNLDELDLVLLDIHLPDIDGVEVLRNLRQRWPKLSVIMLTGYGSLTSAVESMRLGAVDYLQKPINPEILVARVRVVIEEQNLKRRKESLREQIAHLQSELSELEAVSKHEEEKTPTLQDFSGRFLKKGRLILDLQVRRATFGEDVLNLPPATFDYLHVLAKYAPEVVDYQKLVIESQAYQVGSVQARELAKWHIHVIRNALKHSQISVENLLTVRGVGYRLILD